MNKILIVDDEPIVKLGFKSLVDWASYDIDISYEASNGSQALYLLESNHDIDLVITDINMPIMDGLELIERINSLDCSPYIIVLSAYDDYDLVRKAFKLGIRDYILKYKMKSDETLALIIKIFDSGYNRNSDSIININRAKKNFLRNLIIGTQNTDVHDSAKSLNIKFEDRNIVVSSMIIDDFYKLQKKYKEGNLSTILSSVKSTVEQVLTETNAGEVIVQSADEFTIITSFEFSNSLSLNQQLLSLLNKIRLYLNNYLNINVSFGVSPVGNKLEDICSLYKDAKKNAQLRYLLGKGNNIFPEDSKYICTIPYENIYMKTKDMVKMFYKLDYESTFNKLNEILDIIEHFNVNSLSALIADYAKLIILFNNHLIDNDMDPEHFLGSQRNVYNILKQFETTEEIHEWIIDYIRQVFKSLVTKRSSYISPIIRKSKEYIDKNYADNMILENMCKELQINKSYFSTLFAHEINRSFLSYLTDIRIEHAKELLSTTEMRVYELCEEVGYLNTEHFSRVFKKTTGFCPRQYRKINYSRK